MLVYLLYILSCLFILNAAAFMDPCQIFPKANVNETQIMVIPQSCPHGIIDWPYPRGKLELHFTEKSPFKLCVRDWLGGSVLTLFDNSFGQHKELKPLSQDTDQCIKSNGQTAILEVVAPETLMYMAGFSFEMHAIN